MTFVQEYTVEEASFGQRVIRFVVSDTYDDLLKADGDFGAGDGLEVDVFQLGSIKEDLELDNGEFAIDEIEFEIQAGTLINTQCENALWFCLDAQDIRINRYCAIFFDPDFTDEESLLGTMMFIGKLNNKVSGTDVEIDGDIYSPQVNTKRDWKISAQSFGLGMLKRVKLTTFEEDDTGKKIRPVYDAEYERITHPDNESESVRITNAEITSLFERKPSYAVDGTSYIKVPCNWYKIVSTPYLGNLHSVLALVLNKASDILLELTGVNFTFSLLETQLGITGNPIGYEVDSLGMVVSSTPQDSSDIQVRLCDEDGGVDGEDIYSAAFIHRRHFDPRIRSVSDRITDAENNVISTILSGETPLSWHQYDNLTELLFGIAHAIGCTLVVRNKKDKEIEIQFSPLRELSEGDEFFVADMKDGSLDISSVVSEENTEYYSQSNQFARDKFDTVIDNPGWSAQKHTDSGWYDGGLTNPEHSERVKELKDVVKAKDISQNRLLLSSSWTLFRLSEWSKCYPMSSFWGTGFVGETPPQFDPYAGGGWGFNWSTIYGLDIPELLHSGIFIRKPINAETYEANISTYGEGDYAWRPLSSVMTKLGGEDYKCESLCDYINLISGNAGHYYEHERDITVPYWSGFSLSSDGSLPNLRNIKLGSKIQLKEQRKAYNASSGIFESYNDIRYYTVIGIERSLEYPETKIKLIDTTAFSILDYTGSDTSKTDDTEGGDVNVGDAKTITNFVVDTGESISAGEAVQHSATRGVIKRAGCTINDRNRFVGIALESGEEEESIRVQLTGRVVLNEYNFSGFIGYQLFVRTTLGGLNIHPNCIESGTDEERVIIMVGRIDTYNSFIIDHKERIIA